MPQEREVFRNLSVEENLGELFPRLAERRRNLGAQLSGGEQQMLSIVRALMGNPKLLLLDEPSEGLAPVIVDELFRAMERLTADTQMAVVLVEQHVKRALQFAPRAAAMKSGRIAYDGPTARLRTEAGLLDELVGLVAG